MKSWPEGRTAAVIAHEELAAHPGFCLAYLAHSMFF